MKIRKFMIIYFFHYNPWMNNIFDDFIYMSLLSLHFVQK